MRICLLRICRAPRNAHRFQLRTTLASHCRTGFPTRARLTSSISKTNRSTEQSAHFLRLSMCYREAISRFVRLRTIRNHLTNGLDRKSRASVHPEILAVPGSKGLAATPAKEAALAPEAVLYCGRIFISWVQVGGFDAARFKKAKTGIFWSRAGSVVGRA